MKINESFLVGVDISDGKDLSVISVFKRNVDEKGNVNLKCVNTFYGEEAEQVYNVLMNGGKINEIEDSIRYDSQRRKSYEDRDKKTVSGI